MKKYILQITIILIFTNFILLFLTIKKKNSDKNIILISNKTSGHISNILSIAQDLKKSNYNPIFFLNDSKHEEDIFKLYNFKYYKFRSIYETYKLLKKLNPEFILSSGGGFSIPIIKLATFMDINTGAIEPNYYLGRGNTMMSPYSKIFSTNFDNKKYFGKNFIHQNNPIRGKIKNIKKSKVNLVNHNLNNLLILTGTNGLFDLNKYIYENLDKLKQNNFKTYWQKGIFSKYDVKNDENIFAFNFDKDIHKYYEIADLVISAGGANTINELIFLEKPFLLFPSKKTFGNHQIKNCQIINDYINDIYFLDSKEILEKAAFLLKNKFEYYKLKEKILKLKSKFFNSDENLILKEILNNEKKISYNKIYLLFKFIVNDKFYDYKYRTYDNFENQIMKLKLTLKNDYTLLDEIPIFLIKSFLIAEDAFYYMHNGLPYPIISYPIIWLYYKRGGSGICQQLIKNLYYIKEKTNYLKWIKRKLFEIYLTYPINNFYTKNKTMEFYLNMLYYIDFKNNDLNYFGIKNIAKNVFNKSLKELTLREIIILSSINSNPCYYIKELKKNKFNKDIQEKYYNLLKTLLNSYKFYKLDNEYQELINLEKKKYYNIV